MRGLLIFSLFGLCFSCELGERDLHVLVQNGHVKDADAGSKSDAYVIVKVGGIEKQTKTEWNDNHPEWNRILNLGCVSVDDNMVVKVKDEDVVGSDDLLMKATWTAWSAYPVGQEKTLFDDDHTDDDDGPYYVKLSIQSNDPTPSPTNTPSPLPTAPSPMPTVTAHAKVHGKAHKANTLAIVLPIVLLGVMSIGGALWLWRQELTRDQSIFDRSRFAFTSQEDSEESVVYQAPSMSEMTTAAPRDLGPSSESNYVSLAGCPPRSSVNGEDPSDDNDEYAEDESTYTL